MYAQQQDMIDRFSQEELVQLTDLTGSGQIDATTVGDALADASDEMDSYIGAVAQLPLTNIPPVLTRVCCDIARYRLYDQAAPTEVTARYTASVNWLTQLAKGVVKLGLPQTQQPPVQDESQVSPTTPTRVYTSDTLSDY